MPEDNKVDKFLGEIENAAKAIAVVTMPGKGRMDLPQTDAINTQKILDYNKKMTILSDAFNDVRKYNDVLEKNFQRYENTKSSNPIVSFFAKVTLALVGFSRGLMVVTDSQRIKLLAIDACSNPPSALSDEEDGMLVGSQNKFREATKRLDSDLQDCLDILVSAGQSNPSTFKQVKNMLRGDTSEQKEAKLEEKQSFVTAMNNIIARKDTVKLTDYERSVGKKMIESVSVQSKQASEGTSAMPVSSSKNTGKTILRSYGRQKVAPREQTDHQSLRLRGEQSDMDGARNASKDRLRKSIERAQKAQVKRDESLKNTNKDRSWIGGKRK